MAKMLSATAVARIPGATKFTIAELIGPVEANRQSSAHTIAGQYTAGRGDSRAIKLSGAAMSVAAPDTLRYACFVKRRHRSPSQPPAYVPRNPVTTTTAPNCAVADARLIPRVRSRNAGVHQPRMPMAKV